MVERSGLRQPLIWWTNEQQQQLLHQQTNMPWGSRHRSCLFMPVYSNGSGSPGAEAGVCVFLCE